MALFALVLIAFIEADGPSNKIVNQQADGQQTTETDYRGPAEGYWWPEFSARDTYAQWAMSFLALAATAISIWAVRLLRATLEATRDAVAAANRTADEAKRIGEAQVRAYLSCESAGYKVDDTGFSFWLTIKNNGQSPAIRCNATGTIKLIDNDGFNRDGGFLSVALSDYTEHHTFAADGEPIPVGAEREIYIFMRDEGIAPNIFACMQRGIAGIKIDGNVAWQDVFGEKTISGFTLGHHYPNFDIPENRGYLAAGDLYARALPERTRDRSI
jgi:hypothetical protein